MDTHDSLFVFAFDGRRVALPISVVERVVRAAQVTPLPRSPRALLGVIDVQGQVLPVIDMGALLGAQPVARDESALRASADSSAWDGAPRALELSDQFVIVRLSKRRAALLADAVEGVVARAQAGAPEAHGEPEATAKNGTAKNSADSSLETSPAFREQISGVAQLEGGLVAVFNPDRLAILIEENLPGGEPQMVEDSQTQASQTQASQTQASQTQASQTQASQTQASQTQASQAQALQTEAGQR